LIVDTKIRELNKLKREELEIIKSLENEINEQKSKCVINKTHCFL
jgi:hypothetical protein